LGKIAASDALERHVREQEGFTDAAFPDACPDAAPKPAIVYATVARLRKPPPTAGAEMGLSTILDSGRV
jgi:hypothetical protein